jgi:hypothetical protein
MPTTNLNFQLKASIQQHNFLRCNIEIDRLRLLMVSACFTNAIPAAPHFINQSTGSGNCLPNATPASSLPVVNPYGIF